MYEVICTDDYFSVQKNIALCVKIEFSQIFEIPVAESTFQKKIGLKKKCFQEIQLLVRTKRIIFTWSYFSS